MLSDFYDKSVEEIISEVIQAISYENRHLLNISKECKVPMSLTGVSLNLLFIDIHSNHYLFNKIFRFGFNAH